jgi:sporulation protein YlmC with PRC-barrel domain
MKGENRMRIKEGDRVETYNGEKVGTVSRVVIDPRNKEITNIVVGKGFLFKEDRVLPAALIVDSKDDVLILNSELEDLDQYQKFEVTDFVAFDERELTQDGEGVRADMPISSMFYYPAGGSNQYWGPANLSMAPYAYSPQSQPTVTRQNIPDQSVAMKKGAKIVWEDGEEAGELYEVLVDKRENKATHLVIAFGLLNNEKKLVPVDWIMRVTEDIIYLAVRSDLVERLRVYEED